MFKEDAGTGSVEGCYMSRMSHFDSGPKTKQLVSDDY